MGKVIDTSDLSVLSDDDLRYLAERGRLPEEMAASILGAANTPSNFSLSNVSDEDLITELEKRGYFDDDANTSDPDDYSTWGKSALQEEATKRGLDASGTKAELIERLTA